MKQFAVWAIALLIYSPAHSQMSDLQEAEMLHQLATEYCSSADLDLRRFACQTKLRLERNMSEARQVAAVRKCEAAKVLYLETSPDRVTLACDMVDSVADTPELCTLNSTGQAYTCGMDLDSVEAPCEDTEGGC